MQELSPAVATELREALGLARTGSPAAARSRAEAALERHGSQGPLHAFLGLLCCQMGDLSAGLVHLRAAHAANPQDVTVTANFAAALVQSGAFEEGLAVATPEAAERDPSLRLWRFRAFALQQLERHTEAAAAYERIVEGAPDDWEAWNNLGNARAAAGRPEDGTTALKKAAMLAPVSGPVHVNLADNLAQIGKFEEGVAVLNAYTSRAPDDAKALTDLAAMLRYLYRDAEALKVLEAAVAASPADAQLQIQLGEERMALLDMDGAEQAFKDAIGAEPANGDAYVQLALLFEYTNREHALPGLADAAEQARVEAGPLAFIRALVCRRTKDFDRGLAILQNVPPEVQPIRRAQLEGQFRDRIGDSDGAFASFSKMNRLFKADSSQPEMRARANRDALRADAALVTPSWYAGWRRSVATAEQADPVFLVGFPRSGTTLLDTMLMGHPQTSVLEEQPALRAVEQKLGGIDRLPDLSEADLSELRSLYFEEVGKRVQLGAGRLLIDKSPLHMNQVPLIHRLFPSSRFILALRHPCDVVLSCYITGFRLNAAMANFIDLDTAAEYYDLSFGHWTNCTSIMPIQVHQIRYEDVVEDSEAQLRGLIDFLGLPWDAAVVDHETTARSRGPISTASYAQVTEGLYRRASGRWERYRSHLEPVLPILAPWVEKFGYTM